LTLRDVSLGRSAGTIALRQHHPSAPDIDEFLADLRRQDAALATLRNFAADLHAFDRRFADSTGEPFSARAVTPTDLRDHRSYLRTVEQKQAATVNRQLAALRKVFLWAKGAGKIAELPTEQVKGVSTAPRALKALSKRQVDRLIREAERHGNKRKLAILLTLRHTGLRVGEFCNVCLGDVTISERKGEVLDRGGKGNKDRTVSLNSDIRRALAAYLALRPTVAGDSLGRRQG
jgi:site-specific recombinase XerD